MLCCCSNRSAALLKLSKANKALEDADECIRLRPEWDKGHFRRAQVLEMTGKHAEVRLQLPLSPPSPHTVSVQGMGVGHHATALPMQALDAMREAMQRSPGNEEMERKVRQLQKMAGGPAPAPRARREKENQCGNEAAAAQSTAASRGKSKEALAALVSCLLLYSP